jgi:hypothetical protein
MLGDTTLGGVDPKVISPNIRVVALFSPHLTGTVSDRIT